MLSLIYDGVTCAHRAHLDTPRVRRAALARPAGSNRRGRLFVERGDDDGSVLAQQSTADRGRDADRLPLKAQVKAQGRAPGAIPRLTWRLAVARLL